MGTGGQGRVVRMVAVAKLPPPPAAGPPQPRAAGSTQPPRRAASRPSTWPRIMGPAASLTTAKVAASCPLLRLLLLLLLLLEVPHHLLIHLRGGRCLHGALLPPGPPAGGRLPPLLLGTLAVRIPPYEKASSRAEDNTKSAEVETREVGHWSDLSRGRSSA